MGGRTDVHTHTDTNEIIPHFRSGTKKHVPFSNEFCQD
jgi:hypothetical protein